MDQVNKADRAFAIVDTEIIQNGVELTKSLVSFEKARRVHGRFDEFHRWNVTAQPGDSIEAHDVRRDLMKEWHVVPILIIKLQENEK